MNVVTFKHLNKTTNSCQQTIHQKPTNPPTHPPTTLSKEKHFQNDIKTKLLNLIFHQQLTIIL